MFPLQDLADVIKEKGIKEILQRPIFIDELGREETEVKDFGTVMRPIVELISKRYEVGARILCNNKF